MEIIGAGGGKGGGGGGRVAQEAADSLRSTNFARVLDLLAEGEIEGLVNGAQSIYLNETQLQNADGSYNFKGVTWAARTGTQAQTSIPGFAAVENTVGVGTQVKAGAPITRTFTNQNLSAVVVTIGIPQLFSQNKTNGDISGTSVEIAIDLQTNGGGFVTVVSGGSGVFTGKCSSRYQRSIRIPLSGTGPWDVRVRRITADSTSQALQNQTWWDSSTEVIDARLRYPNSALVAISCDASQFDAIPRRAYDVKLLRVKVPTNYDPTTRTYTGTWDGTFKIAWTDNPAWCWYDLITNTRYGLGDFVSAAQVDKWALYSIGQYCDQLVPDGTGGFEPRFTCNLYLQTREEAYKVIRDMASIFRGMVFWSSASITAVQDAPASAAALYTPANVIDGLFNYSGSAARARHTVALVTWNDPADFCRPKVEYVEDVDGVLRYGVQPTEIVAFGCTSRGQANRVGRWLLFTERMESETVTFTVGLEGAVARPGQVIKVADPTRAAVRYGGRIMAATTTQITLDAPVTLTANTAYTLSVYQPDGTVQDRVVANNGGTLSVLTVTAGYTVAPDVGSIWLLSGGQVSAQTFRVVSAVETDNHQFAITALQSDPSKYNAVELGLKLEPRSISALTAKPSPVTDMSAVEAYLVGNGSAFSRVTVSFVPPTGAVRYAMTYRKQNDNTSPEVLSNTPSIDVDGLDLATYTFTVYAINAVGVRSTGATLSYTLQGKLAPPTNVTGFNAVRGPGGTINFAWSPNADADIDHYEIRKGNVWQTATVVGSAVATAFSAVDARGGQFMIRAVDTSGNYSLSEAVVSIPDSTGINVVVTFDASTSGFAGTYQNSTSLAATGPIKWGLTSTWAAYATWGQQANYGGGVVALGDATWSAFSTGTWQNYQKSWPSYTGTVSQSYYITNAFDVGYLTNAFVSLDADVDSLGGTVQAWNTFTRPWKSYAAPTTWVGAAKPIAATFEISTSNDNITYSAWVPFTPGQYQFRYVKIRVGLATYDSQLLPYLTALRAFIDVPDRVDHFGNVSCPTSGVTLSFTPQFIGVQTVQVTLQSAANGDRFTVTGKTTSSVTINVFDSAGNPKAGTIDVDVFGYGQRT